MPTADSASLVWVQVPMNPFSPLFVTSSQILAFIFVSTEKILFPQTADGEKAGPTLRNRGPIRVLLGNPQPEYRPSVSGVSFVLSWLWMFQAMQSTAGGEIGSADCFEDLQEIAIHICSSLSFTESKRFVMLESPFDIYEHIRCREVRSLGGQGLMKKQGWRRRGRRSYNLILAYIYVTSVFTCYDSNLLIKLFFAH